MASERRRGGLGTGLAAILPSVADAAPHPALAMISKQTETDTSSVGAAHSRLISATLSVMLEALDVDCCAYLHQRLGEGPHLAVCANRAPDAFDMLAEMKRELVNDDREKALALAGFDGVLVSSNGERSRGVHLVAVADVPLHESTRQAGRSVSRLFAAVIHRLEAPW